MFEKEAEEYVKAFTDRSHIWSNDKLMQLQLREAYKDGAEFAYNKANEWHYVKDGDFPEEEKEYLIYTKKKKLEIRKIHISGDGKNYLTDVFLMRDLESVIAWKEIVPPELKE